MNQMFTLKKILFFVALLFCFSPSTFAKNIYVNGSTTKDDIYCSVVGNDQNNGLTTSTPKRTLVGALSVAVNGDVIYVDVDIYPSETNIQLSKKVTIIGAGSGKTIFDGGNSPNYFLNFLHYLFLI